MNSSRNGIIFLFACAILVLILGAFSVVNAYIIFALAGIVALYFLSNRQAWVFLVLTPLSLLAGQFISVEIRPNWVYDLSLGEVFLGMTLLMFFFDYVLHYPHVKVRFGKLGWLLLAYALLGAASYFYITDFQLYVAGLKVLLFGTLAYFLALNLLNNTKKIKAFLYSLVIFVVIASLQIFYTFYTLGFSSAIFFNRSDIMIPYGPIALVAATVALLLPILLAYYFYLAKHDKGRLWILIAFALGSIAIFMMLGKAAILSLALGLCYLLMYMRGRRLGVLLFYLLFAILSYVALSQYATGLVNRIGTIFVDKNTSARIGEYQVSYKIVTERPWLGVGSGQQLHFFERRINPNYGKLINNYFVQAAVDYGLIGLALFLLIFFAVFRQAAKGLKKLHEDQRLIGYGLNAALIVAVFNGLFEVTIFTLFYAMVLWSLVGLMPNLRHMPKDSKTLL